MRITDGNVKWYKYSGNKFFEESIKDDPEISTLEQIIYVHTKMHTCITASLLSLFIIAKEWKQPKCLLSSK